MRRLARELVLLSHCEKQFGVSAHHATLQLIEDFNRPNGPEPPQPPWVSFDWPASGEVDLRAYWSTKP